MSSVFVYIWWRDKVCVNFSYKPQTLWMRGEKLAMQFGKSCIAYCTCSNKNNDSDSVYYVSYQPWLLHEQRVKKQPTKGTKNLFCSSIRQPLCNVCYIFKALSHFWFGTFLFYSTLALDRLRPWPTLKDRPRLNMLTRPCRRRHCKNIAPTPYAFMVSLLLVYWILLHPYAGYQWHLFLIMHQLTLVELVLQSSTGSRMYSCSHILLLVRYQVWSMIDGVSRLV